MEWLFEKWNMRARIGFIWLRLGTEVASSCERGKEHLNISGLTAFLLVKSCRRFGAAVYIVMVQESKQLLNTDDEDLEDGPEIANSV